MKIGILGWGSLIWYPKNLRVSGEWNKDGPQLPIEFGRISRDGRLTLVILPSAIPVPVLWARMDVKNLDEAIQNLKEREETTTDKIGFIDFKFGTNRSNIISTAVINKWAQDKKIDAVIWTDLSSKFVSITKMPLNEMNVVSYLSKLKDEEKQRAEEYVRKTPYQIKTKFRIYVEKKLGWKALMESKNLAGQ